MTNLKNPNKKQLRNFGFLIGLGLPLVIGFLIPLIGGHDFRQWTLLISVPSLILGILRPILLNRPYKLWMRLGYFLGWINSRLILGLIFLLVLQPIAFIMKLLGYDPLKTKNNFLDSFRESKNNHKVDLTRIF
ncbi:SxtJ family membrane protein [Prochlorococcus sp. AH-716-J21]|nr:SxtJ family membrane protein [Prochlorococcus sp. AH-716-J21]